MYNIYQNPYSCIASCSGALDPWSCSVSQGRHGQKRHGSFIDSINSRIRGNYEITCSFVLAYFASCLSALGDVEFELTGASRRGGFFPSSLTCPHVLKPSHVDFNTTLPHVRKEISPSPALFHTSSLKSFAKIDLIYVLWFHSRLALLLRSGLW